MSSTGQVNCRLINDYDLTNNDPKSDDDLSINLPILFREIVKYLITLDMPIFNKHYDQVVPLDCGGYRIFLNRCKPINIFFVKPDYRIWRHYKPDYAMCNDDILKGKFNTLEQAFIFCENKLYKDNISNTDISSLSNDAYELRAIDCNFYVDKKKALALHFCDIDTENVDIDEYEEMINEYTDKLSMIPQAVNASNINCVNSGFVGFRQPLFAN